MLFAPSTNDPKYPSFLPNNWQPIGTALLFTFVFTYFLYTVCNNAFARIFHPCPPLINDQLIAGWLDNWSSKLAGLGSRHAQHHHAHPCPDSTGVSEKSRRFLFFFQLFLRVLSAVFCANGMILMISPFLFFYQFCIEKYFSVNFAYK